MAALFEILTLLGSIAGILVLGGTLLSNPNAPQLAAGAAFAVALGALPYFIAASFHRSWVRRSDKVRRD